MKWNSWKSQPEWQGRKKRSKVSSRWLQSHVPSFSPLPPHRHCHFPSKGKKNPERLFQIGGWAASHVDTAIIFNEKFLVFVWEKLALCTQMPLRPPRCGPGSAASPSGTACGVPRQIPFRRRETFRLAHLWTACDGVYLGKTKWQFYRY